MKKPSWFSAVAKGAGWGAVATAIIITSCSHSANSVRKYRDLSRDLTTSEVIYALRDRRMSAEAYYTSLFKYAEVKPVAQLNAFITLNKEGALASARALDKDIAAGKTLGPLAGVPIIVKDNINTAQLKTTAGTAALKDLQPKENAPSLQRLIDAGAIVVGKANMHELAFGITSTNLHAGIVRNPYNEKKIPGGSSGGTAVAIAMRIAPAGLGTDTGGSTRIPAALTGTVGLRPSVGNGGVERFYKDDNAVVPISHTRDTVGPMGRTVADVAILDSVIRKVDYPKEVPLKGLRLGVPKILWEGLDPSVKAVVDAAKQKLEQEGVTLVYVDLPTLFDLNSKVSFPIALTEPLTDLPAYLRANGYSKMSLTELTAKIASPDVKAVFENIKSSAMRDAYPEAMSVHRPALQALYASYFKDNTVDAILYPTTILPAADIDAVNGSSKVQLNGNSTDTLAAFIRNVDPASNAGIPGISLFAGMTSGGLPVGIELDSPLGTDSRLLGIAMSVEKVLGTAPPPPQL